MLIIRKKHLSDRVKLINPDEITEKIQTKAELQIAQIPQINKPLVLAKLVGGISSSPEKRIPSFCWGNLGCWLYISQ